MINTASLEALDAAQFGQHFMRPLYDRNGFAQIPRTIPALFTGEGGTEVFSGEQDALHTQYDAVVLFFVDAFGWRFFQAYADHDPFLRRIVQQGLVSKLSAQFPSTTSAHVTTIHTGLPVGESGVYEWFYYEPQVDAMIAPLLYSFAGDSERGTLARTGVTPAQLYPTETLYQLLRSHDVESLVFYSYVYSSSPFTTAVSRGATVVPYRTLSEAFVNLGDHLGKRSGPTYYFLYFDAIDTICHLYGPDSPQLHAEIEIFLHSMESLIYRSLSRQQGRTLLLLTADHGQTAIDPATTIYLNRSLPEIVGYLRANEAGHLLVPAGSSRDLFLHVKPERMDEAEEMLQRHLAGKAEVHRVRPLIDQGFFGPSVSPRFLDRVGDLVILPYAGESVWWYEERRFVQRFYGSHGGLTRDEMETVLLAQSFG